MKNDNKTDARPRCALATGWVPVSIVDALCSEWENRAYTYMARAERAAIRNKDMIRGAMDATLRCRDELQAQMEAATVRQLAPNQ